MRWQAYCRIARAIDLYFVYLNTTAGWAVGPPVILAGVDFAGPEEGR